MNATKVANLVVLVVGLGLIVALFIVNPLNTIMLVGALVTLSATLRVIGYLFNYLTQQEVRTDSKV